MGPDTRAIKRTAFSFLVRVVPSARAILMGLGPLRSVGWLESHKRGEAVDAQGQPIPWLTYAAISFLTGRVSEELTVFEFGAGNSTLWWADRVASVVSCEHDAAWASRIRQHGLPRVTVIHQELGPGYPMAISGRGPFDIVVIDGRQRNACGAAAIEELSPRGVVIWDDSERSRYQEGIARLEQAGFRRIDFLGPGPVEASFSKTSVLYRDANCLGI